MTKAQQSIVEILDATEWGDDRAAIQPVPSPEMAMPAVLIIAVALANAYNMGQADGDG
jgi:hypothetical protein